MYIFFSNFFLFLIGIENYREILCSYIRALTVGLGKIMSFEKELYQRFITDYFQVIFYFDSFKMSCFLRKDFFIWRMLFRSSHQPDGMFDYAL